MMQDRLPSISRKPTARNSADRSPHKDRTAARLAPPGLIVTTRKIAARVKDCSTACGTTGEPSSPPGVVMDCNPSVPAKYQPSIRQVRGGSSGKILHDITMQ